jgi:hypothetical protein
VAAPTFVSESETAWNTATSPKTASVTVQNNDRLVVIGATGDASTTLGTPTGGSLTYTLQQSVVVTNYTTVYVWTATATSATTFSVSITRSGGTANYWGFNVLLYRDSDGFGASSKTNVANGAPSLGLTTSFTDSAIVVINADWSAVDGTTRTWRQVNGASPTEQTYFRDSTMYTVYAARHANAGTAGAKTVGLSAPGSQKYSIAAVEVRGTAGGTNGTITTTVGDATADGQSATFRVDNAISTVVGDATGDGGSSSFTASSALVSSAGDATADGGSSTFGVIVAMSTNVGDATADGQASSFLADSAIITSASAATADGLSSDFTASSALVSLVGDATADGGSGTFTTEIRLARVYRGRLEDTVNRQTYNVAAGSSFTATIGTASADRHVVIGIHGRQTTNTTVTSATIGGVTATILTDTNVASQQPAVLAYAKVTSGTTADVEVVFSQTVVRASVGVHTITGAENLTVADVKRATNSGTMSVAGAAGGVIIATGSRGAGSGTATWSGVTEEYDAIVEAGSHHSGGSAETASAGTVSVTCTWPDATNTPSAVAAALGPSISATLASSVASATADGGSSTFTGESGAADGTITTVVGDATADGQSATFHGAGTVSTAVADATADGQATAFLASSTLSTVVGDATADGAAGTFTASSALVTTAGDAAADGQASTFTGTAVLSTSASSATADGGSATFHGGATLTSTAADASADGGVGTFTAGGSGTLATVVGSATADGLSSTFAASSTLTTTSATATADGLAATFTVSATLTTSAGSAAADGAAGNLTASASFTTQPGDAAAAGGIADFTVAAVFVTLAALADAAGGVGSFRTPGAFRDITVTLGPPERHPLALGPPERHPLTLGRPERHPLTLGTPEA